MESIFQARMVVEEGGKSASSVPWKKKKQTKLQDGREQSEGWELKTSTDTLMCDVEDLSRSSPRTPITVGGSGKKNEGA